MNLKPYTPHEFKVMRVRECLPQSELLDTPERAAEYWKNNIPNAPWFDPAKEAVVVLALNTRRRLLGHNLVTLGSLDTCIVTPLSVFRPVMVMAGSALIVMHNHPSLVIPHPVLCRMRVGVPFESSLLKRLYCGIKR
jgi:DNA repair protein RadC